AGHCLRPHTLPRFFSSLRHYPHSLHYSPTRRSSDLDAQRIAKVRQRAVQGGGPATHRGRARYIVRTADRCRATTKCGICCRNRADTVAAAELNGTSARDGTAGRAPTAVEVKRTAGADLHVATVVEC